MEHEKEKEKEKEKKKCQLSDRRDILFNKKKT